MYDEKTFQGVPVVPGKSSNPEKIFNPGYTGQMDEYGLDVPSENLNHYYNPSGTYSLMNGRDNTLNPHLESLKNAALKKYKEERAVAEKDERKMNIIKRRHPGLVRNLGPNFAAAAGKHAASASASASPKNPSVSKALEFRKSRKGKSRRQRRQRKTRRQRK